MVEEINRSRALRLGVLALAISFAGCSKARDVDSLVAEVTLPDSGAGRGTLPDGGAIPIRNPVGGAGGSGAAGTAGIVGSAGIGGTGGGAGRGGGLLPDGGVSHDVSSCMPCQASMSVLGTSQPCCTASNKCGLDLGQLSGQASCIQQNAPGIQTMACPSVSLMGAFTIPGCCGADGLCGLYLQQLGVGCVHASDLGALGMTGGTGAGTGGRGGRGGTGGTTGTTPTRCAQIPPAQ